MKKITYKNITCDLSIAENCSFHADKPCKYSRKTVAYAVERFLSRNTLFCKECTWKSRNLRIAKGKGRRPYVFTYLAKASSLELPGGWVRITGSIDVYGVSIKWVELLSEHHHSAKYAKSGERKLAMAS